VGRGRLGGGRWGGRGLGLGFGRVSAGGERKGAQGREGVGSGVPVRCGRMQAGRPDDARERRANNERPTNAIAEFVIALN